MNHSFLCIREIKGRTEVEIRERSMFPLFLPATFLICMIKDSHGSTKSQQLLDAPSCCRFHSLKLPFNNTVNTLHLTMLSNNIINQPSSSDFRGWGGRKAGQKVGSALFLWRPESQKAGGARKGGGRETSAGTRSLAGGWREAKRGISSHSAGRQQPGRRKPKCQCPPGRRAN